jgi:asparagine synthase (glutamine-hydrolysing)
VVTANTIVTRRYWDFEPRRRGRRTSFRDCADGFRHYFDQSIKRRLRSAGPVAVSVSGGLDSSAIFCAGETIRRADSTRYPALVGTSYVARAGSPADENAFLLEIENKYRLNIQRFDDLRSGGMHRSTEAIWHAEAPLFDMQWSGLSAFLTGIRERGARVLLAGHWGDQFLFDDAYLFDLFRRGAWITAWTHAHRYPGWLDVPDSTYFSRRFATRLIRNLLPDAIVPALRRLRRRLPQHRNLLPWYTESFRERAEGRRVRPPAPAGFSAHGRSLYREARSRYHVLCMEWHNKVGAMHDVDMAFPYLDRDLIAFLMEMPGELQSFDGIPKAILREGLRGVLPDAIAQRRSKADATDLGNEELATHYDELTACLHGGLTGLMGYVRRDAVAGQLARMRPRAGDETAEASRSICDLVALELWLRLFFEPKHDGASGAAASVLY